MNHYVYETTNNVDGKKYIGKHSTELDFSEDDYYGSGTYIRHALNKYGKENFSKKLLGVFETEEEAFAFEEKEIERTGAYFRDDYYNLVKGGKYGYSQTENYERFHFDLDYLDLPLILDPDEFIRNYKIHLFESKGYKPSYIYFYIAYNLYNQVDENKIINDCLKLIQNYSISQKYSYKNISEILDSFKRMPKYDLERLCDYRRIVINCSELEVIKCVNDKILCKILTILLLFYKRFAITDGDYVKFNEIELLQYAHMQSHNYDERQQIWNLLVQLELIEFDDYKKSYRLLFADFSNSSLYISLPTITQDSYLLYDYYCNGKYYICKKCGGIRRDNKQHSQKYCTDCKSYTKQNYKLMQCVDCGKEYVVNSKNTKTCRCSSCQEQRNSELNRISSKERMKKYRNLHEM